MSEKSLRLIEPGTPPDLVRVESWIGKKAFRFWILVSGMITRDYPGVFTPEWIFGGKKHGWSLRYKKSKSFCTLIPEKDRFLLLIVFGADERSKVERIRHELSARTRKDYDVAKTYHDGKWVLFRVENEEIIADMVRLLALKRKPKTQGP